MPADPVKRRIVQALRKEFSGKKDKILIRNDYKELLLLYVVSTKFTGKDRRQKVEMIANTLTSSLEPDASGAGCA
jgi:hypothetical protein